MAGETTKAEAICLDVRPWSKTSHIVSWLTSSGKVSTIIKGAVRPKSIFLGQYDLNYTCEIVYYSRAKGELHALRECYPLERRDHLRSNYYALVLAGYFRWLIAKLAPMGMDCQKWYDLLAEALSLERINLSTLIWFELSVLDLSGVAPDFSGYDKTSEWSDFSIEVGAFVSADGRRLRVAREVSECLNRRGADVKNIQILLDAARVIGVFYNFHLDCVSDVRRSVLSIVMKNKEGSGL